MAFWSGYGKRKLAPKIRLASTKAGPNLSRANRAIAAQQRRRKFLWSYNVFLNACLELIGGAIGSCANNAELRQSLHEAIKYVALQFSWESALSAAQLFSRTMTSHFDAGFLRIASAVPQRGFLGDRFLHYEQIQQQFRLLERCVRNTSVREYFIQNVEDYFSDWLVVPSDDSGRLLSGVEARWLQVVWQKAPAGHEVSRIGLVIEDKLRAVVRRRDGVDYWQIRTSSDRTEFDTNRLTREEVPPDQFLPPLTI